MLEVRKKENSTDKTEYELFNNGNLVEQVSVTGYREKDNSETKYFGIFSKDFHTSKKLSQYRLIDFPPIENLFFKWFFDYYNDWPQLAISIFIYQPLKKTNFSISIGFDPNLEDWQCSYSFASYYEELSKFIEKLESSEIQIGMNDSAGGLNYGFAVSFDYSSPETAVADEVVRCSNILRELHEKVKENLLLQSYRNSVLMSFDFPEEIKTPCEQYLVYFVQFLRDLGVEASSELKHDAGQVLFSVTPDDPDEALDKIRAALEVYLRLPSSPVVLSDMETEIELQRLTANIHHLKSQLLLSKALVQAKDATIEAMQIKMEYQQKLLSGEIIIDSLVDDKANKKDKEDLFGGIVKLGELEEKGVSISLAEIYRRLKKMFAKDVDTQETEVAEQPPSNKYLPGSWKED